MRGGVLCAVRVVSGVVYGGRGWEGGSASFSATRIQMLRPRTSTDAISPTFTTVLGSFDPLTNCTRMFSILSGSRPPGFIFAREAFRVVWVWVMAVV